MTKRIPQYLRLHVESEQTALSSTRSEMASLDRLRQVFAETTGWEWGAQAAFSATQQATASTPQLKPAPEGDAPRARLPRELAEKLTDVIAELWSAYRRTWDALRASEAELATAIPVVSRPDAQLADQLEATLRGAAELTQSEAAGLYLLDDATTQLNLRASWGLDPSTLCETPRPLRDAIADLEALTGHAVVMEDAEILSHWNPPLAYPAAACVPIHTSSTTLGTLWVFRDQCSDFSDQQTHILEMVAGGLAAELERQVVLRDAPARLSPLGNGTRPVLVPPDLDGWDIACSTVDPIATSFETWQLRFDGRLLMANGTGVGANAQIANESLRLLIRALADVFDDPSQLMTHLNHGLWADTAGGRLAHAGVAYLNPQSGDLSYGCAGSTRAIIVRPDQTWDPLEGSAHCMGESETFEGTTQPVFLEPNDVLVMAQMSSTLSHPPEMLAQIAAVVCEYHRYSAQSIADRVASAELPHGKYPLSVLVTKRLGPDDNA